MNSFAPGGSVSSTLGNLAAHLSEASGLVPTQESSPAAIPSRNAALDGLKYVAAACIVLHHVSAAPGGKLSSFLTAAPLWGLYFFFVVSGYFHGPVGNRGPSWLGRRFVRLAIPYVFWSVVYLAMYGRTLLGAWSHSVSKLLILVFFSGASGLLWTLPALFYCALGAELIVHNSTMRRWCIVVGLGLMLLIYWRVPLGPLYASPMYHFVLLPRWFAVYLLGMEVRALGVARRPTALVVAMAPASIFAAGILGLASHAAWANPLVITLATPLWLVGALILLWTAASGVPMPRVSRLAWGQDYLIGIYVSQLIWFSLFIRLVPLHSLPSLVWIPAAWVFTLGCASAMTALIKSVPVVRAVVI